MSPKEDLKVVVDREKPVVSSPSEHEIPESKREVPAAKILLFFVVAAALFSVFAASVGNWSIFIVAGYCVFMVLYPVIKGRSSSKFENVRKEYLMLAGICSAVCLCLFALVRQEEFYVEAVTLIMAFVGVKLVFYPNYNFEE